MAKGRKSPFVPGPREACVCGSGASFGQCCRARLADGKPPYGVGIVPRFLGPETCRAWIAHLQRQPRLPLGVVDTFGRGARQLATTQDADRITDLVQTGSLHVEIQQQVLRAYQDIMVPECGRRFAWYEDPQVLRYQPGGWYRAHADSEFLRPDGSSWVKGIDRDMSLLLYLNDDFMGGDLSFVLFGFRYRPRTGDLVYFPADHRYAHQAEPVRHGLRYVVVSWAAFTGEPRVRKEPPPASIPLP